MKRLLLADFETMLARGGWNHEQCTTIGDTVERYKHLSGSDSENPTEITYQHTYGHITNTSTLDDMTIIYQEGFSYDNNEPDTFECGTEDGPELIQLEGFEVVDEDGEVIAANDLAEYLPSDFSAAYYDELIIKEVERVDAGEPAGSNADHHTLSSNYKPDLSFSGKLIASAASTDNNASCSSYSGSTGRFTELELYKTVGGKYVCHQTERTRWQGEDDYSTSAVCNNLDEIVDFYGHGWLAKELYEEAEINAATDIDVSKDSDVETHTITIDNAPDLRFTGECIGQAASSDNNAAGSSYSGASGRWTELALYKTVGGKYICHQVGYTRWQGERDRFSGAVCDTLDEVRAFFGHRWLAKELYESAKIEDVQNID